MTGDLVQYLAIVNTPGYLPDDDDPAAFDTPGEAWWHLYHERVRDEQDSICDLCRDTLSHGPTGDCDEDSETGQALAGEAKREGGAVVGTVYGPTPGYDGHHDLGIAYCVVVAE